MLVTYPALFYKVIDGGYYIHIPDIKGVGTQGKDINDAMFMASDYLGIMLADMIEEGETLPKASDINKINYKDYDLFDDEDYYNIEKSFKTMVCVELDDYLESKKLVKKTLSIPKWVNDFGNKKGLNFSKLLTNAIEDIIEKH